MLNALAFLFAMASLWLGIFGTGTRLLYHWPALAVLGFCLVMGLFARGGRRYTWSRFSVASVVTLAAYVLVRAHYSPIAYSSMMDIWLLLGCLATYILFVGLLHEDRHRGMAVTVFVGLGLANSAVAFYQRLVDPHFDVFHEHEPEHPIPGSGLYFHYDHMAGFTELVALFCFAMAIFGQLDKWKRAALTAAGIVCSTGVLATMSRGGLLSLGGGLCLLGLLTWLSSKRLLWSDAFRMGFLLWSAVAIIGLAGAGWILIGKRFENNGEKLALQELVTAGLNNRLEIWKLALRQWQLAPGFGTGSGTYNEYSIKLWRKDWHPPDNMKHPIYAHNDYLQMLAEYGVVGLSLVVIMAGIHFGRGLVVLRGWIASSNSRSDTTGNNRIAFLVGALCCLFSYGIHSILDFNMRLLASASVIAFALAVIASSGRRLPEGERNRQHLSGRVGSFAGALLGLVLIGGTICNIKAEYHFEKLSHALREGRSVDALAHGVIAVQQGGRNHDLHRLIGDARMACAEQFESKSLREGFLKKAIEAYREAVLLDAGDSEANILLGRCLEQVGNTKDAESAYRAAQAWDPCGHDANGWLGDFLFRRGVGQLSRGELKRAVLSLEEAKDFLLAATHWSIENETWKHQSLSSCLSALEDAIKATGDRSREQSHASGGDGN